MTGPALLATALLLASCGGEEPGSATAGVSSSSTTGIESTSTSAQRRHSRVPTTASTTTPVAEVEGSDAPGAAANEGSAALPTTTRPPAGTQQPPPATEPSTTAPPQPPPPPPPPPTVPVHPLPPWTGSAGEIGTELAQRMVGVSWHEGCPVPIADLRHLRLDHVGFDGHRHSGELIVHADAAGAVLDAFRRMYEARFPIERVTLVDEAGGDDDVAMAANLTTAFNCRRVTGGSGWSEHSYGRAIDVNPLQNPYVSSRGTVLPPGGVAHLDRSSGAIGMIVEGGPAVAAFDAVGWHWGGRWSSIKDYQHFSANGR